MYIYICRAGNIRRAGNSLSGFASPNAKPNANHFPQIIRHVSESGGLFCESFVLIISQFRCAITRSSSVSFNSRTAS